MDGIEILDPSSVSRLGDTELLAALWETERLRRRAYAVELAVLAEVEARGVLAEHGYPSLAALVRTLFALGAGHARVMQQHARALAPTLASSGARIEPQLPIVAGALAEGVLGPEHVQAIRAALHTLPAHTSPEDREAAERILTDAARQAAPADLARLGREIRDRLDPDGDAPPGDDLTHPHRRLDLQQRGDGGVRGTFELDPESGALLTDLLWPLAAPRTGEDGGPDRRGRCARQGDALAEVLKLAARCPDTPSTAGEPVTLFVSASLSELKQGIGRGVVDGYLNLSVAQIRRLACDCHAAPLIFGNPSEILDVGRTTRTVPRRIRRALIHRDGGCTFPGCARPLKHCHAHHIWHWIDGGPTALWNLALLCERHHRLIHHGDWDLVLRDGIPHYRPPTYLDPDRVPRRNTLHRHRAHSPFRSPAFTPPCTNPQRQRAAATSPP